MKKVAYRMSPLAKIAIPISHKLVTETEVRLTDATNRVPDYLPEEHLDISIDWN